MKEKEKTGKREKIKMTCGPENVKFFSQTLKQKAPDAYALVKAFYEAGLIVGLRGVKLETGIPQVGVEDKKPVTAKKTAKFCKTCKQWEKDRLGDDTGAGTCLINAMPKLIKWPNTPACPKYSAKLISKSRGCYAKRSYSNPVRQNNRHRKKLCEQVERRRPPGV